MLMQLADLEEYMAAIATDSKKITNTVHLQKKKEKNIELNILIGSLGSLLLKVCVSNVSIDSWLLKNRSACLEVKPSEFFSIFDIILPKEI